MTSIETSNVDDKLNYYEQQLNSLFIETMYLREIFNHKIDELKQQINSNVNMQSISDDEDDDEDDDDNEDDDNDDGDDENNTNTSAITNKSTTYMRKTRRYRHYMSTNKPSFDATKTPSVIALDKAFQLSMQLDKPIMSDYWKASLNNSAFIGVAPNGTKLLVKSAEEYTSPISNIYKSENNLIVITQNSIYIVDETIKAKKITQ